MRYLPHTPEDIAAMLAAIGVPSIEALFATIPQDCRRQEALNLPPALTEWELNDRMHELAGEIAVAPEYSVFLGAGSYDHYIPASIQYLLGRSEFLTSYTPYQPEISQGTLQAIFEYQTLTCRLLGMDVANASMYDGASALAEALLMAIRVTRRTKVAISTLIHPLYRQVVRTYFAPTNYKIVELPYDASGRTDLTRLPDLADLAAIAVQSPNFFGGIEDLHNIRAVTTAPTLLIAAFTEPLAFGLFKNPGCDGADIVCGEGQSLGIPPSFGGPGLGMFATKTEYVRSMPGRLVGQTTDKDGKRGFVLTLATREQHIRRERATSNICTNQGLCATTAAMYMASLGGAGLRELAQQNYDKTEYLKRGLQEAGCKIPFSSPTFNEFVVEFPTDLNALYQRLLQQKIVAGLPLKNWYPELANHALLCVTETSSKAELDLLIKEVAA